MNRETKMFEEICEFKIKLCDKPKFNTDSELSYINMIIKDFCLIRESKIFYLWKVWSYKKGILDMEDL